MNAIKFLTDNKVLTNGRTKFMVTFENGRQLDFCELMEDYANQPKWISVETEKPEEGERVIVKTTAEYIGSGVMIKHYWWLPELDQETGNITHWQPLPK